MTPMTLRVIQFSTGNVGVHSLRAIIENPTLELVGVHAASPSKVGRDAAGLCGIDTPTGVIATDDLDALVALGADCVVYTTLAEQRPHEALAELTAFLEAGTNVVATSLVWLVYPPAADAWLREPLEAACLAGGTTMYVNGIDPGFSGDMLPFAALSLTTRADRIHVQEICDYGSYDDAEFTGASMGFGVSPDELPMLYIPGVLTSVFGGAVQMLADELDVELDEIRDWSEVWTAVEPIDCTMMHVDPGKVAAVRFAVEGVVDGEPVIIVEHVNRLTAAAAPEWPYPPEGKPGVHRVVVSGHPGIEVNTHVGLGLIDHNIAGVIATGAKVVNAIPSVCAAEPGLVALRDLPVSQVAGLMPLESRPA
jgi:2,4-diaminopentanoate dehydrogenase